MADDFLVQLFEHKAWSNQRLVEAFRAAPPEADRGQVVVALFTFDHTSRVDRVFRAHLGGPAHGLDTVVASRMPDLDAMASVMVETDAWFVNYAGRATPHDLATVVEFAYVDNGDPGCMTKGQMLAHLITHGASHRGAIGKMLELAQVSAASDMVTTFVSTGAAT
ncbi:MAG TPA: DinB family protein [Caulobacteraceae bacterium]|jgi:uncharacterized damage-inducible protein DinB